jgi:hypothetical protein
MAAVAIGSATLEQCQLHGIWFDFGDLQLALSS